MQRRQNDAAGTVHAEDLGHVRVDRLTRRPRPWPLKPVIARFGLRDKLGHQICGNGKADPIAAARPGEDPRVDANEVSIDINQGPAGIARVDRRVSLKEIALPCPRCGP